jgi:acyl-coenzyme A thioesterase PaaI-like protein
VTNRHADAWEDDEPLFLRKGHSAGDLLEARQWKKLKVAHGHVEVLAHLPAHLLNPRQQLFGGFTGTYVDMMSIWVTRALGSSEQPISWSSTVNMRIDYFEPVLGPEFRLVGKLVKNGRSTCLVSTEFIDDVGSVMVYAITTLRKGA